jgi:hypothetical protein
MTRNQWLIIGGLGVTATPLLRESSTSVPSALSRPPLTTTPKPTEILRAVIQSSDAVTLIDQRCIGKEDDMTCVFTVQNSGGGMVGAAYFDINVFDPQGTTLSSSFIVFNNLFPGQTRKGLTHIGAPVGTKFGKYTVGPARTSDLFRIAGLESNPFQVGNAEVTTGTFGNEVVAIVSNTSNKTIDNAEVTAILYDKSGAFIGGGYIFAPIILPNGKARVEIPVSSNGTASKIEVYPAIGSITTVK